MIECSCLCEKVSFRVEGALKSARFCHCDNCRKFCGTSPAAWAMTSLAALHISDDGAVGRFDSGGGIRCFCSNCGSPVWFESKDYPTMVAIPLGVTDTGEVPTPEMHLWANSRPHWCAIHDELPRFSAGPESDLVSK